MTFAYLCWSFAYLSCIILTLVSWMPSLRLFLIMEIFCFIHFILHCQVNNWCVDTPYRLHICRYFSDQILKYDVMDGLGSESGRQEGGLQGRRGLIFLLIPQRKMTALAGIKCLLTCHQCWVLNITFFLWHYHLRSGRW